MQIIRTIVWVLLLAALAVFCAFNWKPVDVTIWQNLVLETKLPALIIVSFLIGLVPMWLLHRTTKWQMQRRILSLEVSARTAAAALAVNETAEHAAEAGGDDADRADTPAEDPSAPAPPVTPPQP